MSDFSYHMNMPAAVSLAFGKPDICECITEEYVLSLCHTTAGTMANPVHSYVWCENKLF